MSTEIEHVEMTLSNLHDSVSFESYASFELSGIHGRESATAVGQVFTFDQQQRLVAVFRGVRMCQMKQCVVEHLVHQASGVPEEMLATPMLTLKGDEGSCNDQMRRTISAVFRTTLGIDHIPVDRKLAELGLDSLTGVEIGVKLERLVPNHQLPGEFLVQPDTTLATLFDFLGLSSTSVSLPLDAVVASHLMSLPSTEKDAKVSTFEAITPVFDGPDSATSVLDHMGTNPELIQDKPGTLPLMLIHNGGGTALAYRLLGDVGRTVLGVHSPGLCEGKGIVSIRHAIDQYAHFARQWLDQHTPHGSRLLIGGWSLGGTIAIALAASHPDLLERASADTWQIQVPESIRIL
ncbi:hypothetical protein PILCRDRAFT_11865 [Piloderma croceum F 1598]|uniref:Carrier domain-containing protein n=1 Tax=Piloderma croceum (strain F 1598) TaxID=765440 RepID=A0A0C3FCT4_PILCF|nr:hypothetical protein PILCRDRAFT_11865 [Piloderma croceum F 1598]